MLIDDLLFVIALDSEIDLNLIEGKYNYVVTGVGKVNATHALSKYLASNPGKIKRVINIGTSGGGLKMTIGNVFVCNSFIQYDMDATAQGCPLGQAPFDSAPPVLEFENFTKSIPSGYLCATADRFATGQNVEYDVYEMEAAALAKVCHLENVQFNAIKYISDLLVKNAETQSDHDWRAELPKAKKKLTDIVLNIDQYLV